MADDLDPLLARWFAESDGALPAAQFVAALESQLKHGGARERVRRHGAALVRGIASGLTACLRLRVGSARLLTASLGAAVLLGILALQAS